RRCRFAPDRRTLVRTPARNLWRKRRATPDIPYFVSHESFERPGAEALYGRAGGDDCDYAATYMPDEVTRDCARRMHYAAWRLSRWSQRGAADRLAKSWPLDALPDGEPHDPSLGEGPAAASPGIDEYLRDGCDLLSSREKQVLRRRFSLDERTRSGTLEQVG